MGVSHQHEIVDKVLKTAYASVASVVIFQAQDILKLDQLGENEHAGYGRKQLEMENETGRTEPGSHQPSFMACGYIWTVLTVRSQDKNTE